MNLDLIITENLERAIAKKDDDTTISILEKNNNAMRDESDSAPQRVAHLLKKQVAFNKMMIKRIQTGKY